MYVYEGEDYSKCSDEDKRGFDQLLAGMSLQFKLLYMYFTKLCVHIHHPIVLMITF